MLLKFAEQVDPLYREDKLARPADVALVERVKVAKGYENKHFAGRQAVSVAVLLHKVER